MHTLSCSMMFVAVVCLAAACDSTPVAIDGASPDQANVEIGAGDDGGPDLASPDGLPDLVIVDTAVPDGPLADLPVGCNMAKIGLTQANPGQYELWEL